MGISNRSEHRSRMREKILKDVAHGGCESTLEDYELLEMLLYSAHPRGDTRELAKDLIQEFGGLGKVVTAGPEDLKSLTGVGNAAISSVKLLHVILQRILKRKIEKKNVISNWQSLMEYCWMSMGNEKVEEIRLILLNSRNEMLGDVILQRGTLNRSSIYIRELIRETLKAHASSVILLHNHPSGSLEPSTADLEVTQKIQKALGEIEVSLHDHVIVSKEGYYSFKSKGLIGPRRP